MGKHILTEKGRTSDFIFSLTGHYWVQIYLCHRYSGQKLKDIGTHFGIGVSGVSQASRRVAMQIKGDKRLKKKVDELILDLGLSTV